MNLIFDSITVHHTGHSVSLPIGSDKEVSTTDVHEAHFLVEGDGARVPFPDTQPQVVPTVLSRTGERSGHEPLGHALPMRRSIDIEPVKLDGTTLSGARWGCFSPDLGVRNERVGVVRQQGDDIRVGKLPGLLVVAKKRRQVSFYVFGPIVRSVGFNKRACRKRGELSCVGHDAAANEEVRAVHLRLLLHVPLPPTRANPGRRYHERVRQV